MKKNIIFTGSELTGKTLFAKMIFGNRKTAVLDGRQFDPANNIFQFDLCTGIFTFDTLIIDDVKPDFDYESLHLISYDDEMIISRKNRNMEVIKTPRFVLITNYKEKIPTEKSFTTRFKVIDFDEDPISDLMKIIKDEKIIIKTAQ